MDTWKEVQKKKMEVGGNKAFREYLQPYGLAEAAIEVKYKSKAAEYYRDFIRHKAGDAPEPAGAPSVEEGDATWDFYFGPGTPQRGPDRENR